LANLLRCGLSAIWNPFAARTLKKLIRREQPDIAHCHNTFPLMSPSIFAACHDAGIPVIQTIHNYRHICPAGGFFRDGHLCEECMGTTFPLPALKHRCYRGSLLATTIPALTVCIQRIRRTFTRDVDAVIALNEFEKNKLIEGGFSPERVLIKPNFCPEPDAPHPPDHTSKPSFILSFAGRLSVDKGIHVLLEAWSGFMDRLSREEKELVCLRIAGDGELRETVAAAASGPSAGIQYLGSLSHDKTLDMIRESDCLACPSIWYEGMPMTILEAFSFGIPVIASQIGGLPELIEEEQNGLLFSPGEAPELAALLHRLYADPGLRSDMMDRTRAIYRERYTEEVNYPQLDSIYRETIRCRQSAS
jgi:glycosyltransferase involved in cell wall biosynthesis